MMKVHRYPFKYLIFTTEQKMSKRHHMQHSLRMRSKKSKPCSLATGSQLNIENENVTNSLTAIHYIRSIFPERKLGELFPPVIFKHQLYSLLKNRTDVDRDVNNLAESGLIKIFFLQHQFDEFMIILTKDFASYVQKVCEARFSKPKNRGKSIKNIDSYQDVISRFLVEVVPSTSDISISEDVIKTKFGFSDEDLSDLVSCGLITLRDAGSWWFSVPNAGQFVKILHKGRQAALKMIRTTKYKEILLSELKSRRAPASMKLGILYHVHDLMGSDLVQCIETQSGILLRNFVK